MTTFPPELVEIIVRDAWYSAMPSYIRKSFMTTCPRINRTWKAAYAPIASRDMYITNLAWLDYLCDISHARKSIIYHDFIPRLTRSITCFVDLRENEREGVAKAVYRYLVALPNILGFQALFSRIHYISFQLVWIGTGQDPLLRSFRGILIYARYDRFLSNTSPHHHDLRWVGKTRMDVYFSMMARDSPVHDVIDWSFTLYKLREVGVPGNFFLTGVLFPGPHEVSVIDGVRHIRQSTYICETQLGSLDSRDINKRLWIASKRWHRLRCLASLFYHREFKHGESYLPVRVFPTRNLVASMPTLLERENLL
ncbi:hypothetical protein ARMSODRAFT_1087042 [Armillaria solidipes]|uniref:Uncharacterized protein n=1 Tax=Armillaria solidipes TaxID=1076256 RepID=A0A2H3B4K8_9AGAR|nr:hypothetical protein ARMSODRAFT_1087042 [Armillaria solidipes]